MPLYFINSKDMSSVKCMQHNRIEHLDIDRLKLLVIDCQKDNKMRTVIDMDDTRKDLSILWRTQLFPVSSSDPIKIMLI
ncbi:hypothetical protein AYI68_g4222 [Smittium mucronatum]|uniref:Uncharacterized protein n=1 Tax=Smittium mucronatum TaxID=133383 RepID=A0A1R0GXQ3_9FUNG|nr:hypothetical protein AYI68_g4222 [Smittium mucronatum]